YETLAEKVRALSDIAIKSVTVSGNKVSFFKTNDASGTAAYTFDFPTEYFLDQTKTTFVENFTWSATTYPGSTDPSLNGKPVLVLALKGQNPASTTYSFLNMASLVDTYTIASGDSSKILAISGRTISFKVSAVSNNAITVQSDGIHVNISGKVDKPSGVTANNIAVFVSGGGIADGGIAKANIVTTSDIATDTEVAAVMAEVFGS
ncbi:MAG: hypothetical protein IJQ74_00120, partial [Synergistaceae bacterium]|nr:hypothetical protein [Synergistaceae bacterium]